MINFEKDKTYKISYKIGKERIKEIKTYYDIAQDIRNFFDNYDLIDLSIKEGKYCTTIEINYEDNGLNYVPESTTLKRKHHLKINIKEVK